MGSPFQHLKRICRLCWVKCEHFEVLDENTKDHMYMLLLNINPVISEDLVMCTNCAETVKKCFAFKSMCFDTYGYIIPFLDDKCNVKLDLKDVCLNQKENNIVFPKDLDICGFCMGLVISCLAISLDTEENLMLQKQMLKKCLPEMDLTIIKKPVICPLCRGSLEEYFRFLTNSLVHEEKIKKYCETRDTTNNDSDLLSVLQSALSNTLSSEDGNTVNIINEAKSSMNRVNIDKLVEDKIENCMEIEDHQIFGDVLFTPKDVLSCEADKEVKIIDTERGVAHKNEHFFKMDDPECLLDEDIETKTDQQDLKRFQDGIAEPCSKVSTGHLIQKDSPVYESDSLSFQNLQVPKHVQGVHNHLEVKTHRCKICLPRTETNLPITSEVLYYNCDSCSYQTVDKMNLKSHMLNHREVSDLCSYQTKYVTAFKKHTLIRGDASEEIVYQCHYCQCPVHFKQRINQLLRGIMLSIETLPK